MKIIVLGNYKELPTEGMEVITNSIVNSLRENSKIQLRTFSTREFIRSFFFLLFYQPHVFIFTHGPGKGVLALSGLIRLFSSAKIIWIASRPSLSKLSPLIFKWTAVDFIIGGRKTPEILKVMENRDVIYHETVIGISLERVQSLKNQKKAYFLEKRVEVPFLLHVGHIRKNRGLENLIQIKQESPIEVDILVLGSPSLSYDPEVLDAVKSAGVQVVREVVPDLHALYQMADFYLFPVDPVLGGAVDLPLSILEALHCKTPVITTPFGVTKKYLSKIEGVFFSDSNHFSQSVLEHIQSMNHCKVSVDPLPKEFDLKNLSNIIIDFLQVDEK